MRPGTLPSFIAAMARSWTKDAARRERLSTWVTASSSPGFGPALLDDGLGEDAGLLGPFEDLGRVGLHEDAAFVDRAEAAVEEIDLGGGFADGFRGEGGADAVGGGRVVGAWDEDDGGVLARGGEAEDVVGVGRGCVGVECHVRRISVGEGERGRRRDRKSDDGEA
jgi:hypothetical protein